MRELSYKDYINAKLFLVEHIAMSNISEKDPAVLAASMKQIQEICAASPRKIVNILKEKQPYRSEK